MISDERLRKKEHLLKSKEFSRVYKIGRKTSAEGMVLYTLPNGLGHNRIGFSIGSKKVRLATARNRIRRVFREVYRRNKSVFKSGFDIVMVVKKDLSSGLSYDSAKTTFQKLIKPSGLLT